MSTSITLNNGVEIPQLGFGTFQIAPEDAAAATTFALESGYRHIDTAAAYRNESGVGEAIRHSGIPREQIFVTTKLRNGDQGYDAALRAFDRSMDQLGLDYLDLYLIHWPYPKHGLYVESWKALERIYEEGRARAIGISNFLPEHISDVVSQGSVIPAINQFELHPTLQQQDIQAMCRKHGIAVEAYSPLGRGQDLESAVVTEIAAAHGVNVAQVVLRWHIQQGTVVIPKSANQDRIRQNAEIFAFNLSEEEMAKISGLEAGNRTGGDPATFDFPQPVVDV